MENRTKNSMRNFFTGIVKYGIKVLLPFLIRTVMLYVLGEKYLGLNSLFTSILAVLNMTEFGFSNAIVYRLYKPIATNDYDLVKAYLSYLKRIYIVIGTIIIVVGLIITPFISYFIKGDWPSDINIYSLFLIYLINVAIGYFLFGYKHALVTATQRLDIINNIESAIYCLQYVIQIVTLCIFRNYYMYVVITPVCTAVLNLCLSLICDRQFPQYIGIKKLDKIKAKSVKQDVKGVAIYRISEVSRNSFDSIIVSYFLGLTSVAIYNNYYYVFNAIYTLMVIINQSLQSSIGNSIVVESVRKNRDDFIKFSLASLWMVSICTVCLLNCYQPFMILWTKNLILPEMDMILFCIYFYVLNMNNIRNLYFDGNGLWMRGKWSFIIESFGNFLLNVILGKIFGITGVILATIITISVFSFAWRSILLFKVYFKEKPYKYFSFHLKIILVTAGVCITSYEICKRLPNGIFFIIIRLLISIVLSNIVLFWVYRKSVEFQRLKIFLCRKFRGDKVNI